ncbi:MAG: hypothetical protein IJS47_04125 [Clostridia bacterium]|nr:hypothetical protein [Clostridia bacterium]
MKRNLKLLIISSLCVLLVGFFNKKETPETVITALDIDFLKLDKAEENYKINGVYKLDNTNFAIFVEYLGDNKSDIYKYNLADNTYSKALEFENKIEYIGVENENKTLYVFSNKSEVNSKNNNEIVHIHWPTMKIKEIVIENYKYANHVMSKDGTHIAYSSETGVSVIDTQTGLTKRVLTHKIKDGDPHFEPVAISDDLVIYKKIELDSVVGFGTINISGQDNKYKEAKDGKYLMYDVENANIYYTEANVSRNVYKLNLDNEEANQLFITVARNVQNLKNRQIFLSDDNKTLCTVEYIVEENGNNYVIKLIDIESQEITFEYEFASNLGTDINCCVFMEKNIVFAKDNGIYVVDYTK